MVKEADGLCRNERRHVEICRNNLRKRKFGSHVTLKSPRIFGGRKAKKLEGSLEDFHRPDAQQSRICSGTLSLAQEECVTQQAKDFCPMGRRSFAASWTRSFAMSRCVRQSFEDRRVKKATTHQRISLQKRCKEVTEIIRICRLKQGSRTNLWLKFVLATE